MNASPTIGSGTLSADPSTTPYFIPAGSSVVYSASFNAPVPGAYSIPVIFPLIGDNQSYSGALELTSGSAAITGTVFSGTGIWTSTSGTNWGVEGSSNWSGGAAPGTFPGFNTTDVAVFSGSGSVTGVDLTASNPSLATISFSRSNYTLSGGSLTLAGNLASILVTGGSQQVDSAVVLAGSGCLISITQRGILNIGGNVTDVTGSSSLILSSSDGTGVLTLSGSNTFGGGVDIWSGTLIVDGVEALAPGSTLVVGIGASAFSPAAVSQSALGSTARVVGVPEPGTLAICVVGALAAAVLRRRTRRRIVEPLMHLEDDASSGS